MSSRLAHLQSRGAQQSYAPEVTQGAPMAQPSPQEQVPNQYTTPPMNTAMQEQPASQSAARVPAPPRNTNRYDEYLGTFTSDGNVPPDPYALFTVAEGRVSSPRYLRLTSQTVGIDNTVQNNSGIPIAAVVQPLAEEAPGESPVPLVDMAGQGPFRCKECMCYVNPFWQWIDAGRKVICNLCGQMQEAGGVYFGDVQNRPECNFGTYEFVAPKEYSNKDIANPTYIICLDSSVSSQQTGLYMQVLNSLRVILDYLPNPENTNVGICTFDTGISFYKLTATGDVNQIIINNMEDPFAAEPISSVTFNVNEYRDSLDVLIDKLAEKQSIATGATSLYSLISVLKDMFVGGRAVIFSTQLGSVGAKKLTMRDDAKLYNTDKERSLYTMQDESYFELARDTSDAGLAIDIFACTHQYFDIATHGAISAITGGSVFYHPRFSSEQDGERLHFQFLRIMTRKIGMQAHMRARVSKGLSVADYFGNYKRASPTDIAVGGIDCDKSFTVFIKHDEKLKEETPMFMQFAMLYVNASNQRMIRVFNTCAAVSSNVMNIFKSADCATIANALAKRACSGIIQNPIRAVREQWHANLVSLLYQYRVNGGSATASQFVLPESIKTLPLMSNAAMKLPALSMNKIGADLRMYSLFVIRSMSVMSTSLLFAPRVYSMHDIMYQEHQPGTMSEQETVLLPSLVPCNKAAIEENGIYLVDNGEILLFIIMYECDPDLIDNILGQDITTFQQAPSFEAISGNPSEEAQRISAVVDEIRRRNSSGYQPIKFAFSKIDHVAMALLVEDNTASEMSYPEYISNLHKIVLNKLDLRK